MDAGLYAFLQGVVISFLGFDWYAEAATLIFAGLTALLFPFWDAALLASSGGSPGRALFRFKVARKDTGGRPSFDTAVSRSWTSWFAGMGLGIPLVALVTMLVSKAELEAKGESRWDKDAGTTVVHAGPRWWSWAVLVLLFAGFVALNVSMSDLGY